MGLIKNLPVFPAMNNVENRLRFDEVTAMGCLSEFGTVRAGGGPIRTTFSSRTPLVVYVEIPDQSINQI